ncbi:YlbL family protein [Bifidobacterium gallicum]|uniref:YlbL family protein n=1 Tax=Bifidobacterium gallicum TaxID=78342 RepID=UPI0005C5B993|nr:S16 family serine protease [Bifidobacterium gallicum]
MRRYVQGKPLKYFTGLFAVLLAVIMLLLPSPYVVEMPGPTENVLGRQDGKPIISITGVPTHATQGKLLMVTVNASGVPGYPVSAPEVFWAWIDSKMEVIPQEAVFPIGQTAEQYQQESDDQMDDSQDQAVQAGLRLASELGVDTKDAHVTLQIDGIGGPSAGMMYALGIVDKLTPADETGDTTIAGTGTINTEGEVGAIGGIDLKMLGALRDGASWFLAPESNCDEVVGHVPEGLRDVRVSTLHEAYDAIVAIGKGEGESLPHCTVQ